ncbi:dTDP-4-dehydrorhamnose reductase [Marinibactrum halimedae]|uniref:dTDP-4-dehydrorhamnose reductase n=1 Tax=Marinibactrum halimedae TaxID=1444977 RepID=A0AA37TB21_9GAMM|nr:dTDP-4-dehydrorhamnose reductase [Marinibactrum halimedae]MCD9460450.1 dTDP-4-dehydrorhamnose reductase [Marinibactrum halimedae]GLS25857.1 NAD(P)-dependent oxidoreductase [Marinibactrum halimedae]
MKIVLFGHNGQVGSELKLALEQTEHIIMTYERSIVDFSQPSQVSNAIKGSNADLVINACAYTAVDKAESEHALADNVNHVSVAEIGKATAELNIPAIHISTDYVFDGTANTPYREDHTTNPLGTYGSSKYLGEQALIAVNPKHIILRTSWVFGVHGNNFVKTMLRLSDSRDELNVVADQTGRPTFVGDIVQSILAFVSALSKNSFESYGIYHCSSEGETTWCDFAKTIFTTALNTGLLSKSMTVNGITTDDYPTPAPRPAYSVLDTQKLEQFLGHPLPHWQEGLSTMLHHLKNG